MSIVNFAPIRKCRVWQINCQKNFLRNFSWLNFVQLCQYFISFFWIKKDLPDLLGGLNWRIYRFALFILCIKYNKTKSTYWGGLFISLVVLALRWFLVWFLYKVLDAIWVWIISDLSMNKGELNRITSWWKISEQPS